MLDIINSFFVDDTLTDKKMLEICFPDALCNMKCEYCYGNRKIRTCQGAIGLNKSVLRSKIEPLKDKINPKKVDVDVKKFQDNYTDIIYHIVQYLRNRFFILLFFI
jgi:sulfatase maturation enzyme AslB (radical SAM superfamily)